MKMGKVSMAKIAEKLNVSKSLVSLALSNRYGVNDETRYKIYLAAIQMGYDFQTTRENKNIKGKLAITVFIKQIDLITERFWPEILSGIEKALSRENYRMKTFVWDNDVTSAEIVMKIASADSDGVIIISELPEGVLEHLSNVKIPIVVIDGKEYTDGLFDSVRANNYLGGYLACEHLFMNGHRKLGFVGDINHSVSFKERYNGFKDYIERRPYETSLKSVIQSAKDCEETEKLFCPEIFESIIESENRPTAVMCVNDPCAAFVYEIIQRKGLRIPEDISVIGFDNVIMTNGYKPPLTSINVEKKEIGRVSVKLLVDRIMNPDKTKESILISVNIDTKHSVAKIDSNSSK
jgi:DNA-binding LacI/PurR family transcriptional regulator